MELNYSLSKVREKPLLMPLVIILVATLVFRCILADIIPFLGDEAYYTIWGLFPSWGYYDHTPMVGWFLHILLYFGNSPIILRVPSIILPGIIAMGIYFVLRPYDSVKAMQLAILFLIAPFNLAMVFITTDTPLILFSFFSGVFLFLAIRRNDHLGYYLASGLGLGLAFFSKYFAVLLALSYLVYFCFAKKNRKRTLGFLVLFLCVLPFGLINLYWNYTHAWANILFNVYNRNRNMRAEWHASFVYLVFVVYTVTPIVFYYLCKHRKNLWNKNLGSEFRLLACIFIVPLVFFLGLSIAKHIGFHWLLSFIPFIYLFLLPCLDQQEMRHCIKLMGLFSGVHMIILITLLLMPITAWQSLGFKDNKYAAAVFFFKHKEVRDYLNAYNRQFVFASGSYSQSDLMYYDSGFKSVTFGYGTAHGRQDDFLVDYRQLKHRNFLIFSLKQPNLVEFAPHFARLELKSFQLYGAHFYYTLAYDFDYDKYRQVVLKPINDYYWTIPRYLPHTPSFYCEKYAKEEGCPAHHFF